MNIKLPSSVDIIRCTSLVFHSWCPESTRPTNTNSASRAPAVKTCDGPACDGLYQHSLYISVT